MEYYFEKFISKGKGAYKGGLSVNKNCAYILDRKCKISKNDRIDIYLDKENNAIKIVDGNTYKVNETRSGLRGHYRSFSSQALIRYGIKIGHYNYIGDNIFVLEN